MAGTIFARRGPAANITNIPAIENKSVICLNTKIGLSEYKYRKQNAYTNDAVTVSCQHTENSYNCNAEYHYKINLEIIY